MVILPCFFKMDATPTKMVAIHDSISINRKIIQNMKAIRDYVIKVTGTLTVDESGDVVITSSPAIQTDSLK